MTTATASDAVRVEQSPPSASMCSFPHRVPRPIGTRGTRDAVICPPRPDAVGRGDAVGPPAPSVPMVHEPVYPRRGWRSSCIAADLDTPLGYWGMTSRTPNLDAVKAWLAGETDSIDVPFDPPGWALSDPLERLQAVIAACSSGAPAGRVRRRVIDRNGKVIPPPPSRKQEP